MANITEKGMKLLKALTFFVDDEEPSEARDAFKNCALSDETLATSIGMGPLYFQNGDGSWHIRIGEPNVPVTLHDVYRALRKNAPDVIDLRFEGVDFIMQSLSKEIVVVKWIYRSTGE